MVMAAVLFFCFKYGSVQIINIGEDEVGTLK